MKKLVVLLIGSLAARAEAQADSATVLAHILADKGIIAASDREAVESASQGQRVEVLISLLQNKGVLGAADLARLSRSASALATSPPKRSEPPPVTAESKFPIAVYGTLLMNAVYNTAPGNIQEIPLFLNKQGSDPSGSDKNFAMTARQSRLGLRYRGGQVAGAELSGQFEFDLLGGKAAFPNAMNMDLFRLRLAFGRLDWKTFPWLRGRTGPYLRH